MQVDPALTLDHEQRLLRHVAMLARALAGLEELHVGFDAALPRVHLVMDEVLDEAVGRALERHLVRVTTLGSVS